MKITLCKLNYFCGGFFSIVFVVDFFFHICMSNRLMSEKWDLLFVYASCNDKDRINQFRSLVDYKNNLRFKFSVVGDFNYYTNGREKRGGNGVSRYKTVPTFINHMGLVYLDFRGPPMTWSNRRDGQDHITERIDRSMASTPWLCRHSNAQVFHLDDLGSDHRPLLLVVDSTF